MFKKIVLLVSFLFSLSLIPVLGQGSVTVITPKTQVFKNKPLLFGRGCTKYTFYQDLDNDKWGNLNITKKFCLTADTTGYVRRSGDCNDNNNKIYPGALELCDGLDNNCDGITEVILTYFKDADGDGFGSAITKDSCSQPYGYVTNNLDCNDFNSNISPNSIEICNSIDDNCNGQFDEGLQFITYYRDADGDGYGNNAINILACSLPIGYVTNNLDCNDSNYLIHPSNVDMCNGVDDDCDGIVDEDVPFVTYYKDLDNDGYGNPNTPIIACIQPPQTVTNSEDCNDYDSLIHVPVLYFTDTNGDGYGEDSAWLCTSIAPIGYATTLGSPDLNLASQLDTIRKGIQGLNSEAGFYDQRNYYINWREPRYWGRLTQLNVGTFGYPGSSVSHTWFADSLDIEDVSTIFDGYNSNQLYCNKNCYAVKPQGWFLPNDSNAIIDGANCIIWPVSFTPFMAHVSADLNANIVPIFNAGQGNVDQMVGYMKWLDRIHVGSKWVQYGAEMALSGYCDNQTITQYKTGLQSFVNRMHAEGYKVIADANPIQRSRFQPGQWNWEIANSQADGYDVYWLSTDFFKVSGTNFNSYRDSIVKSNTYYINSRFDSLRSMFPGKGIYVHQWANAHTQFQNKVIEMLYCSSFSVATLSYFSKYPEVLQFFLYNGNKNLGMENNIVDPSWYSLKQQGELLKNGGRYVTGSIRPGVFVIGVKSNVGSVVRIVNLTDNPVQVNEISIDGFVRGNWIGDCYYGNSLSNSTINYKQITDGIIPPYSDTILK